MDDQRRIFVAIALTLAIFLGWQWLIQATRPPATGAADKPAAAPDRPSTPAVPPAQPGGLEAAPAATPAAQPPAAAVVSELVESFETPLLAGVLSSQGALRELVLRGYKEERREEGPLEPVSLVTADLAGAARQALLQLDVGSAPVPLRFVETSGGRFVLSGTSEQGMRATLVVTPRAQQYALDYELRLENGGGGSVRVGASVSMGLEPHASASEGSLFTPPADMVRGFCAQGESVKRFAAGDVETTPEVVSAADWAGLDRQYFVVALKPRDGQGSCRVSAEDKTVRVDYSLGSAELAPGASWDKQFVLYLGPKRDADLEVVAPVLAEVIDYDIWKIPLGFLARPMVAVMNVFHSWTGSWGIAIVLLTFLVKLLLFPVTYKSVVSMRRMQLLKPEIDKLKERFGSDRERMQLEQMKLFREKGVNPLGGCLPMLLQMPVWFALYRMLWTSVDLYQQPFLWLDNLTAKEDFPFLSIAFGLLTVLQQRVTPTTMDSQQAKIMMYVMPLVFTVFMIGLPSGLVLYIVANSILTIVQQLVINRRQVLL